MTTAKWLHESIIKQTKASNFIRKLIKKNDRDNRDWNKIYTCDHSRDVSRDLVILTETRDKRRKLSEEHGNSFV